MGKKRAETKKSQVVDPKNILIIYDNPFICFGGGVVFQPLCSATLLFMINKNHKILEKYQICVQKTMEESPVDSIAVDVDVCVALVLGQHCFWSYSVVKMTPQT